MKYLYIMIILFLVMTRECYAKLAPTSGFSGNLSINAARISGKSNFSTDSNANLASLNQHSGKNIKVIAAPLGDMSYTFGSTLNQQVYIGNAKEDIIQGIIAAQIGYKYQLDSKMIIDFSYLPTVISGDVWKNPYQTDTPRKKTHKQGNAVRLKLGRIAGMPFNFDIAYGEQNIRHDALKGSSLARDAKSFMFKSELFLPLNKSNVVIPAVTYFNHNASGQANSYDSYSLALSWMHKFGAQSLALTSSYRKYDYQHSNPLFNRTLGKHKIKLFIAYKYQNAFGWNKWSLISLLGYDKTSANINFYDEQQMLLSIGMNRKF